MDYLGPEADLEDLEAAEPASSPKAISAWMAMQLSDQIITASRTMDRNRFAEVCENVAFMLEEVALRVDPSLIETHEIGSAERQTYYTMMDDDDRKVLRGIKLDKPAPWTTEPLKPIVDRLVRLGLLTPKMRLTPRGEQIADGVVRRWPKSREHE